MLTEEVNCKLYCVIPPLQHPTPFIPVMHRLKGTLFTLKFAVNLATSQHGNPGCQQPVYIAMYNSSDDNDPVHGVLVNYFC